MIAGQKKRRPYIGVTGFMTRDETHAALVAYHEAWREVGREPTHDIMIGVLMSAKTLAGMPNKYPRRYPHCSEVEDIFHTDPLAVNLIHFASDVPPGANAVHLALEYAGPRCDGFQFNGAWPKQETLVGLQAQVGAELRLVLQAKMDPNPGLLVHVPANWATIATDILIDASCGKGVSLDVDHAAREVAYSRSFWSKDGPGCAPMGLGIAGGLCAETLPALTPIFRDNPRLSIDAEGRLRDDADGGGNLDLDKVRAYLRAAVQLVAGVA